MGELSGIEPPRMNWQAVDLPRSFPFVHCTVDTPIFSGEITAVCVPNPVSDLIIGNVPGVHKEDTNWKPEMNNRSKTIVTTE